jgi:hypothetical protein
VGEAPALRIESAEGGGPAIPRSAGEVFGAQTGGSGNTAFDMTCDRNGGGNDNNAELYETGCYPEAGTSPTPPTRLWSIGKLRAAAGGGRTVTPVFHARSVDHDLPDHLRPD